MKRQMVVNSKTVECHCPECGANLYNWFNISAVETEVIDISNEHTGRATHDASIEHYKDNPIKFGGKNKPKENIGHDVPEMDTSIKPHTPRPDKAAIIKYRRALHDFDWAFQTCLF